MTEATTKQPTINVEHISYRKHLKKHKLVLFVSSKEDSEALHERVAKHFTDCSVVQQRYHYKNAPDIVGITLYGDTKEARGKEVELIGRALSEMDVKVDKHPAINYAQSAAIRGRTTKPNYVLKGMLLTHDISINTLINDFMQAYEAHYNEQISESDVNHEISKIFLKNITSPATKKLLTEVLATYSDAHPDILIKLLGEIKETSHASKHSRQHKLHDKPNKKPPKNALVPPKNTIIYPPTGKPYKESLIMFLNEHEITAAMLAEALNASPRVKDKNRYGETVTAHFITDLKELDSNAQNRMKKAIISCCADHEVEVPAALLRGVFINTQQPSR